MTHPIQTAKIHFCRSPLYFYFQQKSKSIPKQTYFKTAGNRHRNVPLIQLRKEKCLNRLVECAILILRKHSKEEYFASCRLHGP